MIKELYWEYKERVFILVFYFRNFLELNIYGNII